MADKTPFIQKIFINKVRHLKNLDILIDEDRRRTLILTGPNGCGKTSVLDFLCNYLEAIPSKQLAHVQQWQDDIIANEKEIARIKEQIANPTINEQQKSKLKHRKTRAKEKIQHHNKQLEPCKYIEPQISDLSAMIDSYHKGEFLIDFFGAKRESNINAVSGAAKLNLPKVSPIQSNSLAPKFLQFLVNQRNRSAMLFQNGDGESADVVDQWMINLVVRFRSLFKNDQLELLYDMDNFDFTIKIPGREPFRLVDNQLSDGYSSVIQIIAELLLRMEAVSSGKYDMPGIVLIDEIETHLHIELQKEILPFLTDFFPNIQFIVTTHSPFILNSLPDSVVFDLETSKRWECMAPLSASTIIEDYFDSNMYSSQSKIMIDRYGELSQNKKRSKEEEKELLSLRKKLDAIEFYQSPELIAHYQHLRAKENNQ